MMGWSGKDPIDWVIETKGRLTAVFRGAVEELGRDMTQTKPNGGRVPVKTGNLYRSLLLSTTSMPSQAPGGSFGGPTFSMAGVQIGQKVWLGFQAVYAARQNWGFVGQDSLGRTYNQAGNGFVEASVHNWPAIVAAEASYVMNAVVGRS